MGLRKRPLVMRTIRGLDAPLADRSLDIPCQVASPQSLTPFLQTGPLYPSWRTVGKYHWTPDLCLENPRAKPGAFLSRMNPKLSPQGQPHPDLSIGGLDMGWSRPLVDWGGGENRGRGRQPLPGLPNRTNP